MHVTFRMATMTTPVAASPVSFRPSIAPTPRPQNVRQVAIFLTSIGDENCAAVLRHMSEDQVHVVSREISLLSSVTEDERKAVLERYSEAIQTSIVFDSGGLDYATSVLIAAFGPETGKRMADRVSQSLETEGPAFTSLQNADPQQLAKVVQREHPQTIALVLSHVGSANAAKLLAALPTDVRPEVIRRMAALDQISPEVVNKIAKALGAKLKLLGEVSLASYGGVRAAAEVLNLVDGATTDGILNQIADQDAALGQNIRQAMFSFEDLKQLDGAAMRAILAKIDKKILVTALKGASPQLKAHVTSFMSARSSEMLYEDLQAMGPVRIREVEEAQLSIIATGRQLESEGVLSLKAAGGDQYVV